MCPAAIAETVPGFEKQVAFYGIQAPKRKARRRDRFETLNKAVGEALKDPKLVVCAFRRDRRASEKR